MNLMIKRAELCRAEIGVHRDDRGSEIALDQTYCQRQFPVLLTLVHHAHHPSDDNASGRRRLGLEVFLLFLRAPRIGAILFLSRSNIPLFLVFLPMCIEKEYITAAEAKFYFPDL
ncbi:hypothetical protein [Azospirillum formosense]|uniref:hypothetical protein n=1 Tax=Azospirillum formosense TaxID=861533 RepID=UPI001FE41085|nr:hypothetical protein [Azospirillum formosense]